MTEARIPKTAWRASSSTSSSGALIVSETQGDFVTWSGTRPPLVVAFASGNEVFNVAHESVVRASRIFGGGLARVNLAFDVDAEVVGFTDIAMTASLSAWAEVLARASILVVDAPDAPRLRHVLKLAAIAAVSTIVTVADDDDGERVARAGIAHAGGSADAVGVLRPGRGALRFIPALVELVARATPRSLPDGPLSDVITLAPTPAVASQAHTRLFTGRCLVDARVMLPAPSTARAASIALAAPCLLPPTKHVAWIDEQNDVVAVRQVRR